MILRNWGARNKNFVSIIYLFCYGCKCALFDYNSYEKRFNVRCKWVKERNINLLRQVHNSMDCDMGLGGVRQKLIQLLYTNNLKCIA